jgi:hypothetical protein
MERRYLAICKLKERVTYRIEGIYDSGQRILLCIRQYDCPQQIETMLLRPRMAEAFRRVREFNRQRNGEASTMHLKYYGHAPNDGSYPIIRISGRKFFQYLF